LNEDLSSLGVERWPFVMESGGPDVTIVRVLRVFQAKGAGMTIQTLTLGKRKFVVVLEKDFRRLQARAEEISVQDEGDIAEAKRREREPSVSLEAVRKRLGL